VATQEFNCPNCGAPLDYQGTGATMRCPYCETSIVIPAEMRSQPAQPPRPQYTPPPQPIQVRPTVITLGKPEVITPNAKRGVSCLVGVFLVGILIFVAGMIAIPVILTRSTTKMVSQVIEPFSAIATNIPGPTEVPPPTAVPTPTPAPTSIAQLVTMFGSQGIGAGLLNNAEYIAVDGSGTVYVADYEDGRIQAFDPEGKFLYGWQVGDANTHIYGMAVTHDGILYVAYDGDIYRYNGSKGKALDKLSYANGQEFGDLATLPDGGVLGVWYEGRWGMITSLEGHRDDLVWFDADGNTVRTLKSVISGQTDSLALDTSVAVDGLGTIYAMSSYDGAVFKFSPQGKFIDRFDFQDSSSGQGQEGRCIAVDGQGRVYVGGSDQVSVFSPDGSFILSFETRESVYKMAFSEQGDLYIVSGDTVSRYTLGELP
jgi:hypothetical protein